MPTLDQQVNWETRLTKLVGGLKVSVERLLPMLPYDIQRKFYRQIQDIANLANPDAKRATNFRENMVKFPKK